MQTFNFFLVATAFLIAAYASLLEKHPFAAVAVALVGSGSPSGLIDLTVGHGSLLGPGSVRSQP
jgi:hypothetical protein